MPNCITCELVARRDAGLAPFWDQILRTSYWDVVHSYDTSLPGWLAIVLRRHAEAVHELNEEEALELGRLLLYTSQALKEITGCMKTYVIQFAEAKEHPHVHFHVVPRMANMPEDHRSTKVFSYLGVPDEERVSEEEMNRIAAEVRKRMLEAGFS